jgi:hypothetical protein
MTTQVANPPEFARSKSPPFVLPEIAKGGLGGFCNKNHLILSPKPVNLHLQKVKKE